MKPNRRKSEISDVMPGVTDNTTQIPLVRKRRSESRELHLEVLVVADSKMARYHGDNLEHYILTLMSTVALIYKDPSIGNNINVAVVDIVVLNQTSDYDVIHPIAPTTLRRFCSWQYKHNKKDDKDPFHHDTAILITREDLCRFPGACDTLGLAQSGMVCVPRSSCAIVEDNGLSAAFTIAHELAHVMSIPHDDDRKCSKYRDEKQKLHVMARMLDYNSDFWNWSPCSRHYLTSFIDYGYAECLTDPPGRNKLLQKEEFKHPPGQLYPSDRQCEFVFGPKSRICPYMPKCKRLWCTMDDNSHGGCRTQHMPWADGTLCGPGKRCYQGECVNGKPLGVIPIDGQWGEWKQYGTCSRTCGGGIQQAFRQCDSPRPENGGRYCTGYRIKYKSCNTQECPDPNEDYRAQQCAEFNGRQMNFAGLPTSMDWLPQYTSISPNDRCKLHCRPAGSTQYFILREKVVDGTPCGPGTFDVCVNGNCWTAGCDHVLDSKKILDRCGVCDGNNTSCREIKGYFNQNVDYGYHSVVMIPPGASNIFIRQASQHNATDDNYIALKDNKGHYYLNGHFMIMLSPKSVDYYGVTIDYSGSHTSIEYLNSTKPLQKDLFVQVLMVGKLTPPNIAYSYTVPLSDDHLYYWKSATQWTKCSRICNGKKYKKPICSRKSDDLPVTDSHCSKNKRPRMESGPCNQHCNLKWKVVSKSECSVVCGRGIRQRVIKCMQEDIINDKHYAVPEELCTHLGPKPDVHEECRVTCYQAEWHYTGWSKCSVTCGKGIQQRTAVCKDETNSTVPDSHCDSETKETKRICESVPCPHWVVGEWTECSVSCGMGHRELLYWCNYSSTPVSPIYCEGQSVPAHKEVCEMPPCIRWKTLEWSSCSTTCGLGTSQRDIHCVNSEEDILDETLCQDLSRPLSSRSCSIRKCHLHPSENDIIDNHLPLPPSRSLITEDNKILGILHDDDNQLNHGQWEVGEWSECSCDMQLRKRNVVCQSLNGQVGNDHLCDFLDKPASQEECTCEEKHPLADSHELPKPQWQVGLWSQCPVTCGGGGVKRRQVVCYDSFNEVSVDCDPQYKPSETTECGSNPCPNWLTGGWSECSEQCGTGVKVRSVHCADDQGEIVEDNMCNIHEKPEEEESCNSSVSCPETNGSYKWLEGPWSQCSVSCGEGLEHRTVACINSKGEMINDRYCRNPKPMNSRVCLIECPLWQWSEWSECSVTCGNGSQSRRPLCSHPGYGTSGCGPLPDPEIRPCSKSHCRHFKWRKGSWSSCSVSCGAGFKHRQITCTDHESRQVNQRFCVHLNKPKSKTTCKLSPCRYVWKTGEWSECTKSCDGGIQNRSVTCHWVNDYGWADPQPLSKPSDLDHWCDISQKPEQKRICSYGSCSRGFAWRADPWLACGGRCGKGKQKRKVRCFDLHNIKAANRNCDPSLKPKRKRHCVVLSCNPGSCADIQRWKNNRTDGNYTITIRGKQIEVYCHGMDSSTPKDYINLDEDNYAEIYSTTNGWSQTEPCYAELNSSPDCDCNRKDYGLTKFTKIAFNTSTLQVITDDFTFSHTYYGENVPYGTAGDCFRSMSCPRGRFAVSLLNTGLIISSDTSWTARSGYVESTTYRIEDGQVVRGRCGGHCGTCVPHSKHGLLLDVAPP